jgi:DNA-binding transcriptional MerR regulator
MSERSDKSAEAFRTISEVASELDLATHVLRFWESKFPQIKPLKRAGGRRYYRPDDVSLLRRLKTLLHDEGYTIKGAQKLFREEGARKYIDEGALPTTQDAISPVRTSVPQASLFDAPVQSKPLIQAMPEPTPEPITTSPRISFPMDTSAFLPDAPEPEDILDPSQPIAPVETIIIKQGLSDQQRDTLQAILAELQDMKKLLEEAA